jgi:hypothetical protein
MAHLRSQRLRREYITTILAASATATHQRASTHRELINEGFRATLPDTRLHMVEAEEAEVDQIVGHRFDTRAKAWRYRLRFKKMTLDEDEWLGARDLKNAPAILRIYRKEHGL